MSAVSTSGHHGFADRFVGFSGLPEGVVEYTMNTFDGLCTGVDASVCNCFLRFSLSPFSPDNVLHLHIS